jgi:hypothetical protein
VRRLAFLWDERGALDVLMVRGWLGVARAVQLDAELEEVRRQLAELPYLGSPAFLRGKCSPTTRKLALKCNACHLYYVIDEAAGEIVGTALRHTGGRPEAGPQTGEAQDMNEPRAAHQHRPEP